MEINMDTNEIKSKLILNEQTTIVKNLIERKN